MGVRYAQSYYDAQGRTYRALAYIDKAEAQTIYKNRIASNSALFKSWNDREDAEKDLLAKYNCAKNALSVARVIEEDINRLPLVGSSTNEYNALLKSLKAKEASFDGLKSKITFTVALEGDRQGQVGRALSKTLENAGYRTSRGGAAYIVEGYVSFEETATPSIPYNVIAAIEIEVQSADGKAIFSYNKNYGRIAHRASWVGAYSAALREIERDLEENFVKEFESR